jgi:integrase/recombinase XerC
MNSETITTWRGYLAERGRSPHTIRGYASDVEAFLRTIPNKEVVEITTDDCRAWLYDGGDPSTVARHLSSLNNFLGWAVSTGLAPENVATGLHGGKKRQKLPMFLAVEDMQTLIGSITGRTTVDLRDRAIIEFLYDAGVRVQELCDLNLADVDLRPAPSGVWQAQVVDGKGGKDRIVLFRADCRRSLLNYLNSRGVDGNARLFSGRNGHRGGRSVDQLTPQQVNRVLHDRAYQARLSCWKTIHAHAIRHSMATHFMSAGGDLITLARLLGHSTIAMTEKYVHMDTQGLIANYSAVGPRKAARKRAA